MSKWMIWVHYLIHAEDVSCHSISLLNRNFMVSQSSSLHVKGSLGLQYFSLLLTLRHLSLGLKLKPKSTHHQSFLLIANTTLTLSCHTLHLLKFWVVYTYESLTCNWTQKCNDGKPLYITTAMQKTENFRNWECTDYGAHHHHRVYCNKRTKLHFNSLPVGVITPIHDITQAVSTS